MGDQDGNDPPYKAGWRSGYASGYDAGTKAEREACAKALDAIARMMAQRHPYRANQARRDAAAIRARGTVTGQADD